MPVPVCRNMCGMHGKQLAVETTGEKILIGTGLGCTETCPSALFASEPGGFAGLLGVPVPGLELKLVQQR